MKVIALTNFEHNGSVKKGDFKNYSDATALELARKGLVEIVRPASEKKSTVQSSSVSHQAPASPKPTATKSKSGGQKTRTKNVK